VDRGTRRGITPPGDRKGRPLTNRGSAGHLEPPTAVAEVLGACFFANSAASPVPRSDWILDPPLLSLSVPAAWSGSPHPARLPGFFSIRHPAINA
jgi:hypothetical protein